MGPLSMIVLDPRRTPIAEHAAHYMQFKPDTDVALLKALMHAVIEQGLVDRAFVENRTHGFPELAKHLKSYTPEKMARICGIDAVTIREVARVYAGSKVSIIFWGMGVSQHVHGTDNARALISLALMCGQVGRPGAGLHPLRVQNNVQGASDVGLIPMVFPDYQRVDEPGGVEEIRSALGPLLGPEPGADGGRDHACHHRCQPGGADTRHVHLMGENPAMSFRNTARRDGSAFQNGELLFREPWVPRPTAVHYNPLLNPSTVQNLRSSPTFCAHHQMALIHAASRKTFRRSRKVLEYSM